MSLIFAVLTHEEMKLAARGIRGHVRYDQLVAKQVVAFTAIHHGKLWLFVSVVSPSEHTRDKIGAHFQNKSGDTFIYVFPNNYMIEVWN